MKKTAINLCLVLCLVLGLSACDNSAKTNQESSTDTPASNQNQEAPDTNTSKPEGDVVTIATEDERVVNYIPFEGTADVPVVVTAAGQSADASMLDALMKKIDAEYTFNTGITADELGDTKTLIVCSGASSKGLGAAGISSDDEKARTQAMLEATKDTDITVIVAHLGGAPRRGALSDEFTDMCLPYADYIIVVDEGNNDGKFSSFADSNNVPLTIVYAISDAITPLEELFK